MIGVLPKSLEVNGISYDIDSDYRTVLDVICAADDPDLTDEEKIFVCLYNIYMDFDSIPRSDYPEAYRQAIAFIDHHKEKTSKPQPRLMDWEQDEEVLFPAINQVAGFEIRERDYIHWWTFLGYYMAIEDGLFARIVGIRAKKAKKKKLEKWEQEFYNANPELIKLKPKRSEEEKATIKKLLEIMDKGGNEDG